MPSRIAGHSQAAKILSEPSTAGSTRTKSLLIQNGTIITPDQRYVADILIRGESIYRIAPVIDTADVGDVEIIDAEGKYVFPGFIDPHVHIYLPFMGTYAKDTYDSGSRAALVGGTTTLIEMGEPGQAMAAQMTPGMPINCGRVKRKASRHVITRFTWV